MLSWVENTPLLLWILMYYWPKIVKEKKRTLISDSRGEETSQHVRDEIQQPAFVLLIAELVDLSERFHDRDAALDSSQAD